MSARFEGKVGLVTGGASGLGEATARLMVEEGGSVVIADFDAERGTAVAASLGAAGAFARCDVTDENEVSAAIDSAVSRFGHLDAVFANAGIVGAVGRIADTSMEHFDRSMAVLVRGVFCTVKHAARVMVPQGTGGSIVCTASVAGVMGGLGPHVYSMAKAGVIGLARSASAELVRHGIRVNAIAPGGIPTAMTAGLFGDPDDIEGTAARMATTSPLGRSGTARDIAETVLFLCSEGGSYISGVTIAVDAGLTNGVSTPMFFEQPPALLKSRGTRE